MGGRIECKVTSIRKQRSKINKGGMEIPCNDIFSGKRSYTEKLEVMIKRATREHKVTERRSKESQEK